jgi:hypothetical protein
MHQANAFPSSSKEAEEILAEIEACLVTVLAKP